MNEFERLENLAVLGDTAAAARLFELARRAGKHRLAQFAYDVCQRSWSHRLTEMRIRSLAMVGDERGTVEIPLRKVVIRDYQEPVDRPAFAFAMGDETEAQCPGLPLTGLRLGLSVDGVFPDGHDATSLYRFITTHVLFRVFTGWAEKRRTLREFCTPDLFAQWSDVCIIPTSGLYSLISFEVDFPFLPEPPATTGYELRLSLMLRFENILVPLPGPDTLEPPTILGVPP